MVKATKIDVIVAVHTTIATIAKAIVPNTFFIDNTDVLPSGLSSFNP